jgi:hypothetical protein
VARRHRPTHFDLLEGHLAHERRVRNPRALAAWIGRKKYGKRGMARKAAAGRRRARRR